MNASGHADRAQIGEPPRTPGTLRCNHCERAFRTTTTTTVDAATLARVNGWLVTTDSTLCPCCASAEGSSNTDHP